MAYTRQPAGRVTRLSVAVLIDNLRTTEAEGKVTETPVPPEQLERLTALVRDAVGFDATRGDSVNVVNSSFLGEPAAAPGELESVPLWERAWAQTLAKVVAGTARAADTHLQRAQAADARTHQRGQGTGPAPGRTGRCDGRRWRRRRRGPPEAPAIAYEQQIAQARGLVAADPKRGAQVVKSWVATDE
jgi:flagellar M-ring protein FliF